MPSPSGPAAMPPRLDPSAAMPSQPHRRPPRRQPLRTFLALAAAAFTTLLLSTAAAARAQSLLLGPAADALVVVLPSNRSIAARAAAFGPRPPAPPPPPPVPDPDVDDAALIAILASDAPPLAGYLVPVQRLTPDNTAHGCVPVPGPARGPGPWMPGPPADPVPNGLYDADVPPELAEWAEQALGVPSLSPGMLDDPTHDDGTFPWIAVVERGTCAFIDKVRAMQRSGAAGVIVGDNEPDGVGLLTMYAGGDTSDVHVPSVFVPRAGYEALLLDAAGEAAPVAWIVAARPGADGTVPEWTVVDVILASVVAPLALLLCVYTLCRACIYVTPGGTGGSTSTARNEPATPQRVLDALPTIVYNRAKAREDDPTSCVVCLDEFEDDQTLRVLPCAHPFHVACIDTWLTERKNVCPICRFELVDTSADDGEANADDADDADDDDDVDSDSAPLLRVLRERARARAQARPRTRRNSTTAGAAAASATAAAAPAPVTPPFMIPQDGWHRPPTPIPAASGALPAVAVSAPADLARGNPGGAVPVALSPATPASLVWALAAHARTDDEDEEESEEEEEEEDGLLARTPHPGGDVWDLVPQELRGEDTLRASESSDGGETSGESVPAETE
ncbi:hypothetical protein GGF31_000900 [Allomyces arbusculus]|nr:hypothetical protein GGF31_000900 [Allomyces arbusculus]